MELTRFKIKNIPDVLSWISNKAQMVQWSGPSFNWPLTRKQFRIHLESARSDSPTLYPFGVYDGAKIIGYCELSNYHRSFRSAMVSKFIISPGSRNKGHAQFMIDSLLKFGFIELNLNRIALGVFDFNKHAIRCYKKAGFLTEGTLRQSAKADVSYWNCNLMSILKDEWLAR